MNNIIIIFIAMVLGAAGLAAVDTYLPFIPPVTPFMAGAIYLQSNYYLYVLPVGIAMGIGTVLALYVLRKIEGKIFENIKNEKFGKYKKIIQDKITIFVEHVGDFAIVIAHSIGLGAPIAYIYAFAEDVNYKTYTIYTIIGRTLLLGATVGVTNFNKTGSRIYLIIVLSCYAIIYIMLILILIYKYIKRRS